LDANFKDGSGVTESDRAANTVVLPTRASQNRGVAKPWWTTCHPERGLQSEPKDLRLAGKRQIPCTCDPDHKRLARSLDILKPAPILRRHLQGARLS
jgi:hypothetical protein